MPKLLDESCLPPHPLISISDLARYHEQKYKSSVRHSYSREDANDHLHAAALLMAFFEVIEDFGFDHADREKLIKGYESFKTAIALTFGGSDDE